MLKSVINKLLPSFYPSVSSGNYQPKKRPQSKAAQLLDLQMRIADQQVEALRQRQKIDRFEREIACLNALLDHVILQESKIVQAPSDNQLGYITITKTDKFFGTRALARAEMFSVIHLEYYLINEGDLPIGRATLNIGSDDQIKLSAISVHNDFQRLTIGTQLMHTAFDIARESGKRWGNMTFHLHPAVDPTPLQKLLSKVFEAVEYKDSTISVTHPTTYYQQNQIATSIDRH